MEGEVGRSGSDGAGTRGWGLSSTGSASSAHARHPAASSRGGAAGPNASRAPLGAPRLPGGEETPQAMLAAAAGRAPCTREGQELFK